MKFFLVNLLRQQNIKLLICFFIVALLSSCATKKPQYGKNTSPITEYDTLLRKKVSHRFFLVGDAGLATQPNSQQLLTIIESKLEDAGKDATLIFLGDNIYPHGMPPEEDKEERKAAEESLNSQLAITKNFKGKTIFMPGNHDWYSGLNGLEEQEKFVKDFLKAKKSFMPGDGCAIDDLAINDSLRLVVVDSEWFIEDWDDEPTINDKCDIKTREDFFIELEDVLTKNQNNSIILAIHHPLMTNGPHGGQYSWEKQLFPVWKNVPLPVIGSLVNFIRKTSGVSPQDIQAKQYRTLVKRIKTLVQNRDNVIVVSGHDHNLQYIQKDNINQIISGAGSKEEAAKAINPNDFTYGGTGYAILDIYDTYTSKITYFAVKDNKEQKLFEKVIVRPKKTEFILQQYPDNFPKTVEASVYTPEMTQKTGFYKFLFGNYYRSYYSTSIQAPTITLDQLYGGVTPVREGGGHQSMSLRLADKDGKEYVMRGIKKSATKFLQSVAFKDRYVGNEFKNTYTEDFLLDFYTSSHPYSALILDDLSESVGIYHTNPKLYYIPKQNALAQFNENFGDELYMVEERPTDEFKNFESFGKPDAIESTDDVLLNIQKDKKYTIDEKALIRARLFDNIIGDWDRHTDQWRWARYNITKDSVVYKPIPRDHDQAFANYEGTLLRLLLNIPAARHIRPFKEEIKGIRWLNKAAYPMDLAFITNSGEDIWLREAKYLKEHLTDDIIDQAFTQLPREVQDGTMEEIKYKLKKRRDDIEKYALEYREVLLKTVLLTGTDKKEKFVINRLPHGKTEVKIFSIKKDGSISQIHDKVYNRNETKELWIYGLDDDDIFEVYGKPKKAITVRLLGGQNHDTYIVENGKKIKIYDFKSKENTYQTDRKTSLLLTNDYELNTYNFKRPTYNYFAGYPMAGYNPDDGVKIGGLVNYTVNNFNRMPYSQKHSIAGNVFFATGGFELKYRGIFMNIASKWNFALNAVYTSPNFSSNYFGYGNETLNNDEELGMDYNRVKTRTLSVAPSFFKTMQNGGFFELQAQAENIAVENSGGRFINEPGMVPSYIFDNRKYVGASVQYKFENYDNASLPGLGMTFSALGGWKTSTDDTNINFPYAEGLLSFTHKITSDDKLVLSTTFKTRILFNSKFEFYQGATLGGDNDLRGYRRERFTGKESFLQTTDLRYTIGRLRNGIFPVKYGLYGGFDYGRVWIENDSSKKWHSSAGGGFFLNTVDAVTAKVSYFKGSDRGRLVFGLMLGF